MRTHTSKDIIGTKGNLLKGRKVVLCITGSVAAIKSPEIARELMRLGAEVYPVMSRNSLQILHPHLMEWATGNPVVTELSGKIEHVALAGDHDHTADLILIAPSTANTISKIAVGIDDTPVTTVVSTAFGSKIPIVIVPAMHASLYNHPIVIHNIDQLKAHGVNFVGPRFEEKKAKIATVNEVVAFVRDKLTKSQDLVNTTIVITAGPTVEHVDPIRVISNRSSGKMGVALAKEALHRGADVVFIYGPGTAIPPAETRLVNVISTKEMYEAMMLELKTRKVDVVIATAAVSDWKPEKPFTSKVSTHSTPVLNVRLIPTPKIIDAVKEVAPEVFMVAFRAEHGKTDDDLIESAYERLKSAQADLIVVNDVARAGAGFGGDTNEVYIIDKAKKTIHISLRSKRNIAKEILDIVSIKREQSSNETV